MKKIFNYGLFIAKCLVFVSTFFGINFYKKVVKVKQVCLHIFYVVALFCDHQRHLEICRGKFKIYFFISFFY